MQEASISDEDLEERDEEKLIEGFLSDEERDLLVKRLAACSLPTREIVRIAAASGRTVARVMQRWGIKGRRGDRFHSSRQGYSPSLPEILGEYYALQEVTLDAIDQLAVKNGLSLKKLFDLLRECISPFRWAIRSCLACEQTVLTSSPADRYCPACKKKVKRVRSGMGENAIYE